MGTIKKLGVQLLTLKRLVKTKEEMESTFTNLKNAGYDAIYMNDTGLNHESAIELAKNAGLEIIGTAYSMRTITEDAKRVETHCECSCSYNVGVYREVIYTDEEYERFAKRANEIGKMLSKHDGKIIYDHHAREFCKINATKRGMDLLKEYADPRYVSFSLNTFWMQNAGVDVRRFIREFNGRIEILRMQDCDIAMDNLRNSPPVGSGNMYWDGIVEEAAAAGVKYYIVEDEKYLGNLFESLEKSSQFIHKNYM